MTSFKHFHCVGRYIQILTLETKVAALSRNCEWSNLLVTVVLKCCGAAIARENFFVWMEMRTTRWRLNQPSFESTCFLLIWWTLTHGEFSGASCCFFSPILRVFGSSRRDSNHARTKGRVCIGTAITGISRKYRLSVDILPMNIDCDCEHLRSDLLSTKYVKWYSCHVNEVTSFADVVKCLAVYRFE